MEKVIKWVVLKLESKDPNFSNVSEHLEVSENRNDTEYHLKGGK